MAGIDRFPKKACKFCHDPKPNHFPYQCPVNPKVVLKRKVGLKRTPIKKIGKQTKQWIITRATWIRKNPPPIDGKYWLCYLQIHEWCPVKLTAETITLDHVISRSHAPGLRFNAENLKPACKWCNGEKGSRTLEAVLEAKGKRNLKTVDELVQ